MPTTSSPEMYSSMMDEEDVSLIRQVYYVLEDFELELLGLDIWINNPPLDHLGVYEKVLEAGLRFPLSPFILELL